MDPITIAIGAAAAAIAAGLAKGAETVGGNVLVDAYNGLKDLIKRKFGGDSEVAKAVDGVEAKPNSDGRKQTLEEEVAASQADKDPEILQAAQALLEQIKTQPGGAQIIQQATGSYIAQASGSSTATVNAPPKE